MRNMFIVSVEVWKDAPTAKGIQLALENHWGCSTGVRFSVEEGDHKKVGDLVKDYLEAEDVLSKFEAEHEVFGNPDSTDIAVDKEWKRLYDQVRGKRATLVSKLREYGCVV